MLSWLLNWQCPKTYLICFFLPANCVIYCVFADSGFAAVYHIALMLARGRSTRAPTARPWLASTMVRGPCKRVNWLASIFIYVTQVYQRTQKLQFCYFCESFFTRPDLNAKYITATNCKAILTVFHTVFCNIESLLAYGARRVCRITLMLTKFICHQIHDSSLISHI